MKEGGKAVLDGDLFDDLHDHEVLVDLSGHVAEHGRELVLVRSHLFPIILLTRSQHDQQLAHLCDGFSRGCPA